MCALAAFTASEGKTRRWCSSEPNMSRPRNKTRPELSYKEIAAIAKFYDNQKNQEIVVEI
jgi:hypothetical protein